MNNRFYVILVLDQNYIENFELYEELGLAKKSFKSHLRDRGLGLLTQRKSLAEEFYRDGDWQIQLIKTNCKDK